MATKFHSTHYNFLSEKFKDQEIHCKYAEFLVFETLLDNLMYDLEHGQITIAEFIDKQIDVIQDFKNEFCYDVNYFRD